MGLVARRQEAVNELTELKRLRGVAVNEGKDYDQSAIAKLEIELEAIADAEHERVRKAREDASDQHDATRKRMRTELKGLEAERLSAVQDCNIAFRTAAEQIGQILITSRKMSEVAHALSGQPAPIPLSEQNLASRLGSRIAAVMADVDGHRNRLGALEWRGGSLYLGADDWRASEKKLLESHLAQILEGKDDA